MATRPVFIPCSSTIGVQEVQVDFQWFPGMALSQVQRSIASLHEQAAKAGLNDLLEISSKSPNPDGVALSAFNLKFTTLKYNRTFSVEIAFQASKVFEHGGPYRELLEVDSRTAKRDVRLKTSGRLLKFSFLKTEFPLRPVTYFYDWLYINALVKNRHLWPALSRAEGFTDIVFNPSKSLNCQAYSAALFASLVRADKLSKALESPQSFLAVTSDAYRLREEEQSSLFRS
ncbi:DarT1-associated NADAR antitoxin family protein [Burkholderia pseudomallei]|uniref:DarT1-associated NADAR antitoxin family protein n=1 Tax=Burkholderia pseudomallei TaxID=28450 RepID=UPI0004CEB6B7|nr:hypothetical protein BGI49_12260 [Burkholderia pseudomallei]APZ13282.1 hypothetical protein BGI52_12360 [Burkholderia pseudomallei]KYZ83516.1 hypothetical protein PTBPS01_29860 [Burkholderia pseudomallei]OMR14523.1 hypothetical protein AQ718_18085 [Burkholderia pseudomallei]OMW38820.1 hypothetical protein AQ807_30185 [Burkholderia pseudomallei]